MATYLTGSQDLARECGLSQSPSDVTTQTGELARIVYWYRDAYTEIQNRTRWRFLRHGFTFPTVADTQAYAYTDATDSTSSSTISRFGSWYLKDLDNPPKCYLTSSGVGSQYFLSFMPWEWFNTVYNISSQSSGPPAHISIDPQDQIVLGPTPNDAYTVTGEYYRSAQVLAANGDTPEMPTQFHKLIVYAGMLEYAGFEAAQEVEVRATKGYNRLMRQLENNQMPPLSFAAPLC